MTRLPADGCDRRSERALGIHSAAPMQQIPVPADLDRAGNGVEVADQCDRLGAVAPCGDHVSHRIDVDVKPRVEEQ